MFSRALIKCAPWQQPVRTVAQEINELQAWLNVSPAVTSSFALFKSNGPWHLNSFVAAFFCFSSLPPQIQMLSGVSLERGFNHLKG